MTGHLAMQRPLAMETCTSKNPWHHGLAEGEDNMRCVTWLCAGLVGASAVPSCADVMPLDQAAKLFGARPTAFAADLSPDGSKLVYLSSTGAGKTTVKILDLNTNTERRIIESSGKPEKLRSCDFATDEWIVCNYGGNAHVENLIAGFARTVAINLVKNQVRPLGVDHDYHDIGVHQDDGEVLDFLPDDPNGSLLMARVYSARQGELGSRFTEDKKGGLGVDRIDLGTGRSVTLEPPRPEASMFMTDGHGVVRLVGMPVTTNNNEQLTGLTRFRFRKAGESGWQPLGDYDIRDNSGLYPLSIDQSANALYNLKKLDGRDALYKMALDGSGTNRLVARNDQVDIDGVVRASRSLPVIGYRFTDDRPRVIYFDPAYRALAAGLARALPNSPLIEFAGASRDGKKLLVHASSDTDAGIYYLLNRTTHEMHSVLLNRRDLEGKTLASVRSTSFRATDGTAIPAYLTYFGEAPKNRPAIVLPHGGPSARDEWGFDWLAQFLAARGYVVIQPNYRGSAGFGDKFLGDNAFRDWRTAMSDIRDSSKYLVAQGIADPDRIAILGWSYGGYAALLSVVIDPGRYKAVIAIAPVTDLSALRRDAEGFTNEELEKNFIGKGANLFEGSPLQHAASIRAPVLLVHGDLDGNVRVAHSQRMNAALRKAGTPVEFVEYKDLEHQLDDSDARTEVLTKIGALLDRTIGH
jgi:acetyl esterase/lipase